MSRQIKDIEEIKKIQLDILKYVDHFCSQNNIKYALGYGTLIGAVRHKGFIPWDDDIDIIMRRNDYDRFIKLFSKETGRYKVWAHNLQPDYPIPYAKVTDEKTLKLEGTNYYVERGVDIDVFPLDDLPNDEKTIDKVYKKLRILSAIYNFKQIKYSTKRKWYKNLILCLGRIAFFWYSMNKLVADISNNAQSYNGCLGDKCANLVDFSTGIKEIMPKSYTDSFVKMQFEDSAFPVPVEYDAYLRCIYGNYMELPPEEERITHHSFNAWWKE